MDFKAADKEYIVNVYNRMDAVLDHGKGSVLYDVNGKEYIDLSAGIAVNVFGVCDDVWKDAVTAQLNKLSHISNVFYTEPQVILAKMLCEKTGMKKVFFSNSGAESNECAIKAARKYSHDKYGDGRYTIITLKNSFHGRTMATLTACGQDELHQDFGPFLDGFVYAEADNFESVKALAEENNVCAVMMELVQGEGGVHPLDPAFVHAVVDYAHEKDILVIIDEVQTGNGRTGALYAYMNYGIHPDIVTTAKAIGGGLPFAATMYPRLDLRRQPDLRRRGYLHHRTAGRRIDGRSTGKGRVYQSRAGRLPKRRIRVGHGPDDRREAQKGLGNRRKGMRGQGRPGPDGQRPAAPPAAPQHSLGCLEKSRCYRERRH